MIPAMNTTSLAVAANGNAAGASGTARPASFPLKIQGGMLEALGINMYATIGKCLVEFVANAYDSEAGLVEISVPADKIQAARAAIKATAKEEVEKQQRDPFTVLLEPLPDDLAIVIKDNGHGMSPADVEKKFLPINRKRRLDDAGQETVLTSENKLRNVMGRKGLGKLAGFGAATKVVIRTKRKDETFATTFVLDDSAIKHAENLGEVAIPASYEDGLPPDEHGTTITLTGLKADAVRFSTDTIARTIREAFFGIEPSELTVKLNDVAIEAEVATYAYVYPEGATVDDLAEAEVAVEDITKLPIRYMVGFRPKGEHLPTARRGARIYCNNRLAAGPSLFGLPTGMHNFHSQSYMECIVRADDLDRHGIDLVNTNRTQLREDNEIVRSLIGFVEEAMKKALAAHAKWKEAVVDEEIDKSISAKAMMRITNTLEGKAKVSAQKLLRTLAVEHGPDSKEFMELAPLVVESMNAGEVLIRLSELGHDPQSINNIALNLVELADIEKSDALKIYRGRRNGINALLKLIRDGEGEFWKKKGIEKDLHQLLKEEPWLIKPEYSRYLTSDQRLGNVADALAEHLGVDEHAKLEDPTRPDLVFVLSDTDMPHLITIVELKSPSLPLNNTHLAQLKTYMAKVKRYCSTELRRNVTVHGHLIGAMPDDKTTNDDELLLLSEMEKNGPNSDWVVVGVRALLEKAQVAHASVIQALESDLRRGLASEEEEGPKSLPATSDTDGMLLLEDATAMAEAKDEEVQGVGE